MRFGLLRFRSPLLAESFLFSSPRGTKMFQFPPFASACADVKPSTWRVAPFGYPRIYDYLHLPVAFRSLSRPSSPPIAKASTSRPCFLLYFFLVTLVVIPSLSLWYLPLYLLIYSYALCQRSYLRFAEFRRQGRFHATLSYILKKQRMCIGKSLSFACFICFMRTNAFVCFVLSDTL